MIVKYFFITLLIFSLQGNAGGQITSGGGGVVVNGHRMTFLSFFKFQNPGRDVETYYNYIDYLLLQTVGNQYPVPVINRFIPVHLEKPVFSSRFRILTRLIETIKNASFLTLEQRDVLLKNIIPNSHRSYVVVKKDQIPVSISENIISNYKLMTGFSKQTFSIFAFTDRFRDKTYLTEDFFQLTEEEQLSILFHERLWIAFPKENSYLRIMTLEAAFQLVLESKFDPEAEGIFRRVFDAEYFQFYP